MLRLDWVVSGLRTPVDLGEKKALIQPMKARLIENQSPNPIIISRVDIETWWSCFRSSNPGWLSRQEDINPAN